VIITGLEEGLDPLCVSFVYKMKNHYNIVLSIVKCHRKFGKECAANLKLSVHGYIYHWLKI